MTRVNPGTDALALAGRDTGPMLGGVNWVARVAGYVWVGVLAFAIFPTHGYSPLIAYAVLGLSVLAWALVDAVSSFARRRDVLLPVVFGVMAVSAGYGGAFENGSLAMVAFAFVAAMIAGGGFDLARGLAVAAAGIVAIEIGAIVSGASFSTFVGLPFFVVSGLVIGRNVRAYRVRAEQAAALLAQREALAAEQRRTDLLDERARIAREIHDVLAHSLGALGIQIQAARAVLTDTGDVAKATELLANAQQLANEGLVETRRAVHALRSDPPPLVDELAQVSDTYAQRYRVAVDFDTSGDATPLRPDASLALLRITQEALVNAAKHAAGQPVAVHLDYAGRGVRLTVRNPLSNGTSDGPELNSVNGGFGLTGMRERLRLLDGTLVVGGRDGEWVVTAELPRTDDTDDTDDTGRAQRQA